VPNLGSQSPYKKMSFSIEGQRFFTKCYNTNDKHKNLYNYKKTFLLTGAYANIEAILFKALIHKCM